RCPGVCLSLARPVDPVAPRTSGRRVHPSPPRLDVNSSAKIGGQGHDEIPDHIQGRSPVEVALETWVGAARRSRGTSWGGERAGPSALAEPGRRGLVARGGGTARGGGPGEGCRLPDEGQRHA